MITNETWTASRLHLEQMSIERAMHDGGVKRFHTAQRRAIEQGEASATSYNNRLMRELVHPLAQGIDAHLEYYRTNPGKQVRGLSKLRLLDPLTSAFIGLKVMLDSLPAEESLQATCVKIGRKIEDQVRFARLEDTAPHYIQAIKRTLKQARSQDYRHKKNVFAASENKITSTVREGYVNNLDRWLDWTKQECLGIGLAIVEVARLSLEFKGSPVFELARTGNTSTYHIEVSAAIVEWVREYSQFMSTLAPEYSPCVIPPRDWTGPKNGGYYTREVCRTLPLVKVNSREHLGKLTSKQMPEVYDAVNALQRTAWKVNEDVLRVAETVLERNLALAMPQIDPYEPPLAPIPEHLQHLKAAELREAMTEGELAEFKQWKVDSAGVYRKERKRRSHATEASRTIAEAREFSIYPAVYFVYTLDSRGRVYCRSSAMGPQGGDLQKALVKFAKPMQLGEGGRYWLAVHGAGVWGNDKVDFDERVRFIEEDMRETIKDIAADPLTFKDWTNADKPWQFLSWCFEWAAMLDWVAAGNPASSFESAIPVAMDGSCSGIQHYSAMLRDKRGGAAVNLTPGSAPSDIYGEVAKVVREKLGSLAAGALDIAVQSQKKEVPYAKLRRMAQSWLDFGIDRKLCKKPVMILPLT